MSNTLLKQISNLKDVLSKTKDESKKIRIVNKINSLVEKLYLTKDTPIRPLTSLKSLQEQSNNKINSEIQTLWSIWHELKTPRLKKFIVVLIHKKQDDLHLISLPDKPAGISS